MSRVRSKETAPERKVRSILHRLGFRFRKNVKTLPGKPDIVLPRYRTVIFGHGCFWHQHSRCKKSLRPTSNVDYWNEKLDRNIERDRETRQKLSALGWKQIIVWTCELRRSEHLAEKLITNIKPKS